MLNIIVNPFAGKGLAKNNIKVITKYLKKQEMPYLVYFSEKEGDIENIVSQLYKSGEKEYVIVGGDGTIHKIINSIPDLSKIKLGIIPSGTHNNFAKAINLPNSPVDCMATIINAHTDKFDYLQCNDIKVCNSISVGFLENLKHQKFERSKTNNITPFDIIKNKNHYEPIQLNFTNADIKEKNICVLECFICNGTRTNSLLSSPLSNPQDGLANIVCVSQETEKVSMGNLLSIKNGSHIYKDFCKTYWASDFSFTSNKMPIKAVIDGETYELNKPNIKVIEEGLTIYVD